MKCSLDLEFPCPGQSPKRTTDSADCNRPGPGKQSGARRVGWVSAASPTICLTARSWWGSLRSTHPTVSHCPNHTPAGGTWSANWSLSFELPFQAVQLRLEPLDRFRLGRVVVQVVQLVRILSQVEKLPLVDLVEVDQLVTFRCGCRSAAVRGGLGDSGNSDSTSPCASRRAFRPAAAAENSALACRRARLARRRPATWGRNRRSGSCPR